ncbi:hypothetical protein [Paraburkholderia hospita]|uniref:hypothetical protein n=1 Tax=Paraburkholderia hospita TaxID=169430 RepID=UPI003BF96ECC
MTMRIKLASRAYRPLDRRRHSDDREFGRCEFGNIGGQHNVCRIHIGSSDFTCSIMTIPQFSKPKLIDVEPYGSSMLAECDRNGQPEITKTIDRNFSIMHKHSSKRWGVASETHVTGVRQIDIHAARVDTRHPIEHLLGRRHN